MHEEVHARGLSSYADGGYHRSFSSETVREREEGKGGLGEGANRNELPPQGRRRL
jgi:hypothetical protein